MIEVQTTSDQKTGEEVLEIALTGQALQEQPFLNRGLAFTVDERREFALQGLLPPHEETLDVQLERAYDAYQQKATDLERHIYLIQREVPACRGVFGWRWMMPLSPFARVAQEYSPWSPEGASTFPQKER